MKNFFKKLKSEKGATGVDVVVAAAMILMTITVVSILYVNTSLQSRNITRTAGATRIATNIAENIQALSYEEFVYSYNGIAVTEEYKGEEYRMIQGSDSNYKIFDTKIPTGYNFYIRANEVYGSHLDKKEQFDLVRDIEIVLTYKLGDNIEDISFSLTKQREIIGECNAPEMTYLRSMGVTNSNTNAYPIKYVETIGSYVKTTVDDVDWYDCSNKKWAIILVSDKAEKDLFDVNGKYTGVAAAKYMWIPAFFVNDKGDEFRAFRYNGSEQIITRSSLTSLADDEGKTSTFNYYTFDAKPSDYYKITEDTNTGKWVEMRQDSLTNVVEAKVLNNSAYGPFIIH